MYSTLTFRFVFRARKFPRRNDDIGDSTQRSRMYEGRRNHLNSIEVYPRKRSHCRRSLRHRRLPNVRSSGSCNSSSRAVVAHFRCRLSTYHSYECAYDENNDLLGSRFRVFYL